MRIIIACSLFVIVFGIDMSYTKVGYVDRSGVLVLCLNDCVNGLCYVDSNGPYEACVTGNVDAPIAYTFQKRHWAAFCRSRCGAIGTVYTWCYVDDEGAWDYCNGNSATTWVRDKKFTLKNGPCLGDCDGTCHHYWGSWDKCEKEYGYDYIQAHTINNGFCSGTCKKHDGYSYNWCYYGSDRSWDRCAPPMQPRRDSWITKIKPLVSQLEAKRYPIYPETNNATTSWKKIMKRLLTEVLSDLKLFIVRTHNLQNPIYAHAVHDDLRIPVVVAAEITSAHIRNPCVGDSCVPRSVQSILDKSAMSSDKARWLVPYTLGGVSEVFNMVPMYRRLSEGHYVEEERTLINFLKEHASHDPRVKLIVYVIYEEGVTRPYVFLTHTKLYLGEKLKQEYFDVLPNF